MTVKPCNRLAVGAHRYRVDVIYQHFFIYSNTYYAWFDFPR